MITNPACLHLQPSVLFVHKADKAQKCIAACTRLIGSHKHVPCGMLLRQLFSANICYNNILLKYVYLGEVPVLPELLSVQQAPLASQGFLQMPWRAGPVDLPLVQVMPGTCLDESVVAPQHL